MLLEPYHPFEVAILENTPEDKQSIAVNTGKVINFYNPLNFRNVKCNSNGSFLPEIPYDIKKIPLENENKYIEETSFIIEDSEIWKIHIFLCCSFNPPKKWVPGYSYIPMIDNAWLLLKMYSDINLKYKYKIYGDTKNPKESNIKAGVYNANAAFTGTQQQIEDQEADEEDKDVYEETINWLDNSINLGVIATLEKKVETNKWVINQFLKENYIFTDFFSSKNFSTANLEKFNLNEKTKYKKNPSGALSKTEQRKSDIQSAKNTQKFRALSFLYSPTQEHVKGFFRYDPFGGINPVTDTTPTYFQTKYPRESPCLEELEYLSREERMLF